MRIVVDTNVLVSGLFFGGTPRQIVDAWGEGKIEVAVSEEILAEYRRTSEKLGGRYLAVEVAARFERAAARAVLVTALPFDKQVCSDPNDDMFLACALAGHAVLVTSCDKALLATSGYMGIEVLTPRQFVDLYLKEVDPPQ